MINDHCSSSPCRAAVSWSIAVGEIVNVTDGDVFPTTLERFRRTVRLLSVGRRPNGIVMYGNLIYSMPCSKFGPSSVGVARSTFRFLKLHLSSRKDPSLPSPYKWDGRSLCSFQRSLPPATGPPRSASCTEAARTSSYQHCSATRQ